MPFPFWCLLFELREMILSHTELITDTKVQNVDEGTAHSHGITLEQTHVSLFIKKLCCVMCDSVFGCCPDAS